MKASLVGFSWKLLFVDLGIMSRIHTMQNADIDLKAFVLDHYCDVLSENRIIDVISIIISQRSNNYSICCE